VSTSATSGVAGRYASALFELADNAKSLDQVAQDLTSFRKRCADVPGFPLTLFDVMAPSPNAYFTPLTTALNAAHRGTGSIGDFCELIGEKPEAAMMKLGNSVAGVLGAH